MAAEHDARKNFRKCLLGIKAVPTLSELRAYDSPLTDFFTTLDHAEKVHLGLEPPLTGPGTQLWMSPSDVMIGKTALKAPLTSRHLKATTHQAIEEIGEECILKFENGLRIKHERELEELEKRLKRECEAAIARAIERTRKEEKEIYEKKQEELVARFEKLLVLVVHDTVLSLEKEFEIKVQEICDELDQMMRDQFENELYITVEAIESHFKEDALHRLTIQREEFLQFMEYIHQMTSTLLHEIEMRHLHMLYTIKHEMEAANMAEICQTIAQERKKCRQEKAELWEKFERTEGELKLKIRDLELTLSEAHLDTSRGWASAGAWKNKAREALFELQRFSTFWLDAVPAQADFLLDRKSVEAAVRTLLDGERDRQVAKALQMVLAGVPPLPGTGRCRCQMAESEYSEGTVSQRTSARPAGTAVNRVAGLLALLRRHRSLSRLIVAPADIK